MKCIPNICASNRGRADSRTPAIIFIVVVCAMVILAFKLIPVKVRSMKFETALNEVMRPTGSEHLKFNEEYLTGKIQKVAEELNIPPLKPQKNILVKKVSESTYAATVRYEETISFPLVGDYIWVFQFRAVQPF